ncbi:hypothetical protein [Paenibacillus sp. 481]|uniref:hypothetical protein n=1 Tax=Paenibacillus sp. 481 TaxID=2835869 RepID=UPI001E58C645|nr:hypothetical protein [Paenibacillus sp. 481]UHA72297.1 hypothetical protein KIK04_16625 [Paenibacillus sp. 481]
MPTLRVSGDTYQRHTPATPCQRCASAAIHSSDIRQRRLANAAHQQRYILAIYASDASLAPRAHTLLRLAIFLHANIDHRVHGSALTQRQLQQLVRQNAQLVEGVVSVIRLTIALLN